MKQIFVVILFAISLAGHAQNIGVGVPMPLNKLHVGGGFRLDTLTGVGGAGLLRHDANGSVYGIKFSGSTSDVLRGDGTFGSFVVTGAVGWLLNGNSGTNLSTHFIGTTDSVALSVRVNNFRSGIIEMTPGNSGWGYKSLSSNTAGTRNTAIGSEALLNNTLGNDNTAVGYRALLQNIGAGNSQEPVPFRGVLNTAVGSNALSSNVTGSENAAFGANAMSMATSSQGSGFGAFALQKNASFSSSAFGYSALTNNTSGNYNSGFGAFALYTNTTGNENTAIGFQSLEQNVTGYNNTSIGAGALQANKGFQNTAIGYHALDNNVLGSDNIAIGINADVTQPNLTRAIAIGANARVGSSYSMVLGGTGFSAVNVGIGVEIPISTLHVRGSAKIFAGAENHTGNFWNGTSNVSGFEVTSAGNDAYVGIQRATGAALHISKPFGSIGDMVAFFNSSVLVGRIYSDGVSTAYLTTSDSRLKENRKATGYHLETLMQIKTEDYNYISDIKKTNHTGFIAQDLYKVYPQAVIPGGDDTKTNPWMIDYSKLTPLLVKSVQEQQAIIEKQQTQIDALIRRIEALEKK